MSRNLVLKRNFSSIAGIGIAFVLSCGGGPKPVRITCPDGVQRVQIDCSSEIDYQGRNTKGSASFKALFAGDFSTTETLLRTPPKEIELYIAAQRRLCRRYNACIVNAADFDRRSQDLSREILMGKNPNSSEKIAMKVITSRLSPQGAGRLDLSVDLKMWASTPDGQDHIVRPHMPVPSGATIKFDVMVNQTAYLYMFQRTQADGVTALYPHPDLNLRNPILPNQVYSIPPERDRFRVNEQDLGMERVYIIVSLTEREDLKSAVARFAAGDGGGLAGQQALSGLAGLGAPGKTHCATRGLVLEKSTGAGCALSRGLVLIGGRRDVKAKSPPAVSLRVQTDPGDSMIVKVFPWLHVAAAEYPAALTEYLAR